jgi:hypothetical protein
LEARGSSATVAIAIPEFQPVGDRVFPSTVVLTQAAPSDTL